MMKPDHPEIGRELKVSELQPRTIVWLQKDGRERLATVWVMQVLDEIVWFRAGAIHTDLLATRTGPGLEQITDDTGATMKIYEYLGEP